MSKKIKPSIAAVIDIGSNELRLKIAERSKERMKYIESLNYPLSLGRDTFDIGKISFEKTDKTCTSIENFLKIASQYSVNEIAVVATTAVREAVNREYILDQIKIRTNMNVRVLDDAEEKLYIYRLMTRLLDDKIKSFALMVYTGSGNIGISVLEGGRINFTQNIKIGALRVREIFTGLQDYSCEFFKVVDDYLKTFTDIFISEIPGGIKTFIASGHEISLIAALCGARTDRMLTQISRDSFNSLYFEMKDKSIDNIANTYNIAIEKAELLLPSMCIYYNLLEMTKASEIISPQVFLSDAVLFEILYPSEMDAITKEYNKHTLVSARHIADKYCLSEPHYNLVEKFAVNIFDKMKKVHGLGLREKLLLQTAAVLHDIGKFVNVRDHYRHSYNIIKGLDILGLNNKELETVASLSLYHSRLVPGIQESAYACLEPEHRVVISKLAAILRIADALDRSHKQKFNEINVKLERSILYIQIVTDKNIDLEQWSFDDKSRFFTEVFGIKAVIKMKRVM